MSFKKWRRECRVWALKKFKNWSHPLLYILKPFASTLVSIRIHFCEKPRFDPSHSHPLLKLTSS